MVALLIAGTAAGASTGVLALAPILAMAFPLIAATWFLHREGITWRRLGFARAMPLGRFVGLSLGGAAGIVLIVNFALTPLLRSLGAPPIDLAPLAEVIQGDTTNYLLFLVPVAWGSAAFGEELLLRGFVLHRLSLVAGVGWGVVLQAVLFSLGHAYQGVTGMITLFVVGVLFGYLYLRAGRNLWPVIAAHGLIDTISLTLLYLGYADTVSPGG
ncbi:MAG: CPBP family intramembrane glutamic endopeptidase [Pseudomonadota bacterium]